MEHFGIDITNPTLILQEEKSHNFFTNYDPKHLYQVVMKNIEKYLLRKHRDTQNGFCPIPKKFFRRSRQNTKIFRQKYCRSWLTLCTYMDTSDASVTLKYIPG